MASSATIVATAGSLLLCCCKKKSLKLPSRWQARDRGARWLDRGTDSRQAGRQGDAQTDRETGRQNKMGQGTNRHRQVASSSPRHGARCCCHSQLLPMLVGRQRPRGKTETADKTQTERQTNCLSACLPACLTVCLPSQGGCHLAHGTLRDRAWWLRMEVVRQKPTDRQTKGQADGGGGGAD